MTDRAAAFLAAALFFIIYVTVQNRPKHLLLRPYEHDSASKNPIAGGDLHGFLFVSVQVLN